MKKKPRHRHPAVLLMLGLSLISAAAQEGNPFVKPPAGTGTPLPPAGAAVDQLVEYIAVPSAVLDAWQEQDGDAAALRASLQPLIGDGTATPIHSLFTSGAQDRPMRVESIVEQIFPTDFYPSPPDGWPYPTAFETRNTGVTTYGLCPPSGAPVFHMESEWVLLSEVIFYQDLARRTSKPGDMFLPRFRTHSMKWDRNGGGSHNPFTRSKAHARTSLLDTPSFAAGKVQLVNRFAFPSGEEEQGRSVAVFLRGGIRPATPAAADEKARDEYRISARLVEIPQRRLSAWLQSQPTAGISAAAWQGLGIAEGQGVVTVAGVAGGSRKRENTNINQWDEYIYPTEYEPYGFNAGKIPAREEGKPEVQSNATAFETRNVGITAMVNLTDDASGLLLDVNIERVQRLGDTVCRRFRDGNEWKPDMTMPLFSSQRIDSTVRPERGKWMLAGIGSTFTPLGQPEPEKALLTFIRID